MCKRAYRTSIVLSYTTLLGRPTDMLNYRCPDSNLPGGQVASRRKYIRGLVLCWTRKIHSDVSPPYKTPLNFTWVKRGVKRWPKYWLMPTNRQITTCIKGNRGRRIQRRLHRCWIVGWRIMDLVIKAQNDWRDVGLPQVANSQGAGDGTAQWHTRKMFFFHCFLIFGPYNTYWLKLARVSPW